MASQGLTGAPLRWMRILRRFRETTCPILICRSSLTSFKGAMCSAEVKTMPRLETAATTEEEVPSGTSSPQPLPSATSSRSHSTWALLPPSRASSTRTASTITQAMRDSTRRVAACARSAILSRLVHFRRCVPRLRAACASWSTKSSKKIT